VLEAAIGCERDEHEAREERADQPTERIDAQNPARPCVRLAVARHAQKKWEGGAKRKRDREKEQKANRHEMANLVWDDARAAEDEREGADHLRDKRDGNQSECACSELRHGEQARGWESP